MLDPKKCQEKEYHDRRFCGNDDPRMAARKYYAAAGKAREYFDGLIAEYARPGLSLLEYGCGKGGNIGLFNELGYSISGIDISEEGIRQAETTAGELCIPANYCVMDAEKTEFPPESFDLVLGAGILHHLDLDKALLELSRITKKDGHAIFLEPLGLNPFINLYRKLTPAMRTPDEHPLTQTDIQIMGKYFHTVHTRYFCFLSLLSIVFCKSRLFDRIYAATELSDRSLFRIAPFFKQYAWLVVIDLSDPMSSLD